MLNKIKTTFLGILTTFLALTQTCESDYKFDYAVMPPQPFSFEHMDLSITLEPSQHLVRGVVQYRVVPRQDGLLELSLDIAESAVDAVTIDEKVAEYRVTDDSLLIMLPDSTVRGNEMLISVTWQSTSPFGLYQDREGNFWSSKNPLAHHHWLPGFDHPRNELTFDAEFVIPLETEVLFNGTLNGSEVYSTEKKKVSYSSDTEVPFTGLGFAFGNFEITEVTAGLNRIRLFTTKERFTEEERSGLLRQASELQREVENYLGRGYPWEGINMVVLPDNFWEERTHGTGTVFLYENLGSLSAQLKRGMYAQWFGEFHRKEQFFDASGYLDFVRTALHYSLQDEASIIENPDTLIRIHEWNSWQQAFTKEKQLIQTTVQRSLPQLIREPAGVQAFSQYIEKWYEQTGIPFNSLSYPEPEIKTDTDSNEDPEVIYALDVLYDEMNSRLEMVFGLESGSGDELYSMNLESYSFSDTTAQEISFTGQKDTVRLTLDPSVEYIYLEEINISPEQLVIGEYPLYFLTNQLRSGDPELRKQAANLLINFTDNPDIQLALNDVLGNEQNPDVRSALLATMSAFTRGASGTEQQFLDNLNSDDPSLKMTALKALINYPDNEMVKSGIRTTVLRAESDSIFSQAVATYNALASNEEVVALTRRLQQMDNAGRVLAMIQQTGEADSAGVYPEIVQSYLSDDHPYTVRNEAFRVLLQLEDSESFWIETISTMRDDRDPRIRYISLDAVEKLSDSSAISVLNSAMEGEYDARILYRADELKELRSSE